MHGGVRGTRRTSEPRRLVASSLLIDVFLFPTEDFLRRVNLLSELVLNELELLVGNGEELKGELDEEREVGGGGKDGEEGEYAVNVIHAPAFSFASNDLGVPGNEGERDGEGKDIDTIEKAGEYGVFGEWRVYE